MKTEILFEFICCEPREEEGVTDSDNKTECNQTCPSLKP